MMSEIGIRGLIGKDITEIENIVNNFIKSSMAVREGIITNDNIEICMLSLLRDTYTCNLLLRYIGLMTIISNNEKWIKIDDTIMEYVNKYYISGRFKNKLIDMYAYYSSKFEKGEQCLDYCKFLERMITKCEITKDGVEIKKKIGTLEKRIYNIMNVHPIIKINKKYFKTIPPHFETQNDRVVAHLSQGTYYELLDLIDDPKVLHQIESQYMSRTNNVLDDFSRLIIGRQMLAEILSNNVSNDNSMTYYKYINRDKTDNSETIKEFLTELNNRLNQQLKHDMSKIYQSYTFTNKMLSRNNTDNSNTQPKVKMDRCDIIKYSRSKRNMTRFDIKKVINTIFTLLMSYFSVNIVYVDDITIKQSESNNVMNVYNITDKTQGKLLGRLYIDLPYSDDKKMFDPIAVRLADKMQINQNNKSIAEVALVCNYQMSKGLTYTDVAKLFKEFGYVMSNICYESRVGMINYDEEFSNFIPSFMEHMAWDKDIIKMIVGNADYSIVDHIELSRNNDLCYNIMLKCTNAKFDHQIHNSPQLIQNIKNGLSNNTDNSGEIYEIYRKNFIEVFNCISDVFNINIEYIDPITLIQEINSSQGVLYANLMNEIFSYATFWIVKNNMYKNPNITSMFRNQLLNNGVDNYRELIREFIKVTNVNCFELYLKKIIHVKQIDTLTSDQANFFAEDSATDNDIEDIIQIRRV